MNASHNWPLHCGSLFSPVPFFAFEIMFLLILQGAVLHCTLLWFCGEETHIGKKMILSSMQGEGRCVPGKHEFDTQLVTMRLES